MVRPNGGSAPFLIFVLAKDLRSFSAVMSALYEFFVNPMAPIVSPPHRATNEPTSDRPSRNDGLPQMPDFRPRWLRVRQARILNIFAINRRHLARSARSGRTPFHCWAIALTHEPSRAVAVARGIVRQVR